MHLPVHLVTPAAPCNGKTRGREEGIRTSRMLREFLSPTTGRCGTAFCILVLECSTFFLLLEPVTKWRVGRVVCDDKRNPAAGCPGFVKLAFEMRNITAASRDPLLLTVPPQQQNWPPALISLSLMTRVKHV
ncbi:hypothetical protein ACOMHN_034862 [Nucella lapillus]